jgi:hypothetical protein
VIYAARLAEDQGDLKAAQQNLFPNVIIGSEPADVACIFPLLFNIIGDALRELRRRGEPSGIWRGIPQ